MTCAQLVEVDERGFGMIGKDEQISLNDKAFQRHPAFRIAEVQNGILLVGCKVGKQERVVGTWLVMEEWRLGSERAPADWFDEYDIGTEIREQFAAVGAGNS
jgi:hypothetical protein